jgi:uncharacterized membrane protein
MLHRASAVLLLALAAPARSEPPSVLVCRGHEPEWSLRIEGSGATLATLDGAGLRQTGLDGRLQEAGGGPPSFVYRGRTGASGADLVAVITREACTDTMADAAEGGGPADYSARVSLPEGAVRVGCCTIPATVGPPAEAKPSSPPPVTPPPVTAPPAPPATASPTPPVAVPPATTSTSAAVPVARGEITALVLPDGRACQRVEKQRLPTPVYNGQRVNFDCGSTGGATVALIGPLEMGSDGLLTARKALIDWRDGLGAPRPVETTAARVSELALPDELVCRHAGTGATLAFEGRRASYTCGMKDGDTVALLGDLEAIEGGFRIVRARIAQGDTGFFLRASEPILVTAPR